jgi:hypothetical protein
MVGEITWTYQLAPQKTGKLTIPPLSFRDSRSTPVTIEVISGTPPNQEGDAQSDSFIELAADKDEVYVQEQLVLSIKLFFTGNLIRGELSEPKHPNAIVESLGKQNEYTRYRDGVRYRVVERRYALFPQKEGQLSLQPIRFEGQARNEQGQLKFLRDSANLFDITVKGVPAGFSGDTWLPARKLELDQSGLPRNQNLTAGQNLTRSLTMRAEGLPAESLPPFPEQTPDSIRAYPEKPERTTTPGTEGLTSTLTQTTALVPVQPGKLTLPEIRIPWWDTESDSEKVAVIPAHTMVVEGIPGQVDSGPNNPEGASEAVTETNNDPASGEPDGESGAVFWPLATLAVLVGWLLTLTAWWYSRRRTNAGKVVASQGDNREKVLFRDLCEAAQAGSPKTTDLLVRWMSQRHPERTFQSVTDVNRFLGDTELAAEIEQLQQRLFGTPGESATSEPWQGERLVAALIRVRGAASESAPGDQLPPLYPQGLSTSR